MDRQISRLRNGLQVDGREDANSVRVYLQDENGNALLSKDADGNYAGKFANSRNQAITANDDGTGAAVIDNEVDFVTVTSSGATKQVCLPSGAAGYVGKKLTILVTANGCELITPASSNATINNVDSDGTNQADIAANTMLELFLVATNTWLMRAVTNLGAVATAIVPDND